MRRIAVGVVLSLVGNMLAVMSIDAANTRAVMAATVPSPNNTRVQVPVANTGYSPITGGSLQTGVSSGDASGIQPVVPGGLNPAFPSAATTSSFTLPSYTIPATTTTSGTGTTTTSTFSEIGGGGAYVTGPFSSTAEEGYLNGAANLWRSQGVWQAYLARALLDTELARQKHIENWRAVREIRYEDAMRRAYSKRHWTTAERNTLAHRLAPARLPRDEFNRQNGQIVWPSVLREPAFAALRDQVSQLFVQRAAAGGLSAGGYRRLDMGIHELSDTLKSKIRDYPPDLYLLARRFLGSLGYEATLSPETVPSAAQIGALEKTFR